MRLLPDWRAVAKRAWSVRLNLLIATLDGSMLGMMAFYDVVPGPYYMGLSIALALAACLARLLQQPALHKDQQ